MRLFSHRHRAPHLGAFALERLPRSAAAERTALAPDTLPAAPTGTIAQVMGPFFEQLDRMRDGPVAATRAPIPEDPGERSRHLKSAGYFLDASMVGICSLPPSALLSEPRRNPDLRPQPGGPPGPGGAPGGSSDQSKAPPEGDGGRGGPPPGADGQEPPDNMRLMVGQLQAAMQAAPLERPEHHRWALVVLAEHPREPDAAEPGGDWIAGTQRHRAALRSAEVAVALAQYLRLLGFSARAHTATTTDVDIPALSVEAGLALADDKNSLRNPLLDNGFDCAVVTTDIELCADAPLAADSTKVRDFRWWLGVGGARPGYAGPLYHKRPFHLGPYPMETLRRRAEPTTLIDADNVPRVPKRHDMFMRAALGDLGGKAQREMHMARCVSKHPFANAMTPLMSSMVALQRGPVASSPAPEHDDAKANGSRVKAALYYLGADMVGISEAPDYVWYSHGDDGKPIEPYHRYAISVLVDQGYETMEGASGDDWISGAQSVRAYLRTNLLCSIVAAQIRAMGYSARAHSTLDQDVLHIPCLLLSGLGELSRIGELVLNPFVGPRFKSGVITTDMPLDVDLPIDFGLQDFCDKCTKCARECPCSAISLGDKVMFNGYEMWKPDVEKCGRYRITNSAGALCGRCMKTCPFNVEGVLAEKPFLWAARNLPFTRKWIADLDDKVGNGRINPIKKWWWDLDTDPSGRIVPAKRVNTRELNFREPAAAETQKLALYPADMAPPPASKEPAPIDRKAGMVRYQEAMSPAQYRQRLRAKAD